MDRHPGWEEPGDCRPRRAEDVTPIDAIRIALPGEELGSVTRRRCRYRLAGPDPYTADLVRRLRGLLAIVVRPPAPCQDPVRRDDEQLDRL